MRRIPSCVLTQCPPQLEKKRTDMFNAAIDLFNAKNYESALIEFENIVSLEPKNFIGDNFEKVTQVFKVSQYNVACCYSMLDAVEPGLEALQVAMSCGFDDFAKIRRDPSLRALQASAKFKKLLDKYDEPLFNEVRCWRRRAWRAFSHLPPLLFLLSSERDVDVQRALWRQEVNPLSLNLCDAIEVRIVPR